MEVIKDKDLQKSTVHWFKFVNVFANFPFLSLNSI